MASAAIETGERDGVTRVSLSGDWTLASLPTPIAGLEARLADLAVGNPAWNLVGIERIDSVGAILLWRAWGRRWPQSLELSPQQRRVIERVAALPATATVAMPRTYDAWIVGVGRLVLKAVKNLRDIVTLIGQMVLDVLYLLRNPQEFPLREFSATLYKSGAQALPVTALVGFLIGIVLSYLSSLQLKTFGADIFIVNLIGISVIRELGPVIVAVLVAGRSGSAMTAQIGVMRVTEEIDALATMGVSRSIRLVLPKVAALSLAMPLLVIWCSAAGIVGGMVSANLEMGLAYGYFIETLPRAVPVANLWIAIGKGFFFGMLIALIACHFGLKVRPNTESLSSRTTSSVVTAITVVIIVDAVFAILTRSIGMPAV
ncbi:MAG: ABC transporter permease [Propionivibrio sp.]|jgi:phospholipid/cholesterol/gamma-HCH transport system permease protein|uniref:ABC transporter permease n=1 Tax=Propionivibrio sp. TaxID=2212460 RepID=UPI001B5F9CCC|nr:ABC transporter permease [Propionivibrio sp.]MBP7203124.1 ABC transporter permease [Propionivibrio sp.]